MSFSKARIQRFNELTSQVPPPGAYDPKFESKVKGSVAIIEKTTSSRIIDAKSSNASSATDCASICSRTSTNPPSIKPFRTPQIPKKRCVVKPSGMSCPRAKTKLYKDNKEQRQAQYEPRQELADLKVELHNKNKTINDYEKLLEDMKLETKSAAENCRVLQAKLEQIERQRQRDIESMATLQQQVTDNANDKHQRQLQSLKSEMILLSGEYEQRIDEKNRTIDQLRERIRKIEAEQDLASLRDDGNFVEEMSRLEVDGQQLREMSEELNASLIFKDLEMADLLKVQSDTECQLESIQNKLERSEQQVADLEQKLQIFGDSIDCVGSAILDQQLIQRMTGVLQEYFNCGSDDGRWLSNKSTFHPDVDRFLLEIKKLATDLKLTYERDIELSRDRFNEERENLEQQLDKQKATINDLECQLSETRETNNFLTEELQDVQKLYKEANRDLRDNQDELNRLEVQLSETISAHQSELESIERKHYEQVAYLHGLIEEAKNEYIREVNKLEKSLEEEKKRMKECADKMIENAEAVTRETLQACRAESEEKVRRIIGETDAKILDATKALEEKETQYKSCLERVENEMTTLASNLSQRELETQRLTASLEEMKSTAETQESFSQSLQAELDRAEAELVEKKAELRNLKDQLRNESAEMVARRRRFEVVMAENQASVAALTQRLAQSQIDNETLQRQLQMKDNGIEEYRKLLETISQNSTKLQAQLDSIADNIDHKLEYIGQLETANLNQINHAKTNLLSDVEHFKSLAIQLIAQSRHKSEQNTELQANLRQMSERLNDTTDMLLRLEEVNDEQSLEMSKLQLQVDKVQRQLDDKNRELRERNVTCETHVNQHETEVAQIKEQLSKMEQEARKWQRKQEETEAERNRLKELTTKYESQVVILEHDKSVRRQHQSDEKVKQSSDSVDGQRTKQTYQLKDKIDLLRLRQELDANKCDPMDEVTSQINEKLKLEARRQIGMGKENQCNPMQPLSPLLLQTQSPHKQLFPKSANTTPISSPNNKHPVTPLRARND